MKKYIIGFILGAIIFGGITGVVAYNLNANEVSYGTGTVKDAIDGLYNKKVNGVQVATLTTQGASYTMQNDGYIIGTAQSTGVNQSNTSGSSASLSINDKKYILSNWNETAINNVSIFAPKNAIVTTRTDGGTYNLTVYEWK